MKAKLTVLLLTLLLRQSKSFFTFVGSIPNGNAVPNPCRPGLWPGVGHLSPAGRGQTNRFGADFELNNFRWSWRLCRRDSDRDGITNGAELGDPRCLWRPGRRPQWRARGHPGICEPVYSFRCRNQFSPCGRNPFRRFRFFREFGEREGPF